MNASHICPNCNRILKSKIGLISHQKACQKVAEVIVTEPVIEIVPQPIEQLVEVVPEPVETIQAVETPAVEMPLEDLSFSLSEDEEEKVSAEIKVVSESNISVNFDLSNDSVISEAVRCIKCSNQVGDLQKAQVVCHSCHYHTPTQTKEVLNVFQQGGSLDDIANSTVCDLRPVYCNGEIKIYAPTEHKPRRVLSIDHLYLQLIDGVKVLVSAERYKATTQHIGDLMKQFADKDHPVAASELSVYYGKTLTRSEVERLYQMNPRISANKPFYQKIQIDYPVEFRISELTRVFVDIETTAGDGEYLTIPQPEQKGHQITMIQVLLDHPRQETPQVFIFYRAGYQFDEAVLRSKYSDVSIQFISHTDERDMCDEFWNIIMELPGMVLWTGFNACHERKFQKDDQKSNRVHGYDLKWLTTRCSYRFRPNSANCKIAADISAMATQIEQLPNVLFMDYQAVTLQKMPQSAKNKLDDESLGSILKALFSKQIDQIDSVHKIKQDAVQLQRVSHEQLDPANPRVDMTNEFDYAINDVVCLLRCDRRMQYIDDAILTTMSASNIGFKASFWLTTAQIITIDIGRLCQSKGLPYLVQALMSDEVGIDGAYTNNEQCYVTRTQKFVKQDDYNSLYPSVIIDRNISEDTLVCITNDPSAYLDNTKYAIVNVSDDKLYRNCPEQTFVVFDRTREGILPQLCRQTMDKRNESKKGMKLHAPSSAAYKRFNQLQNAHKVKANSVYGNMGSKSNPYYRRVVACCVTAYARNCLAQLNRGVHTLGGFSSGKTLIEQPEMSQVQVEIKGSDQKETRWVRCYFNRQEGETTRIVQNDTDAAFYIVGDMLWFQQAMKDPTNSAKYYNEFHNSLCKLVNGYLGGSEILKFACEEFIVALISAKAKKSYIRLDVTSQDTAGIKFEDVFIQTIAEIYREDENGVKQFNNARVKELIAQGRMDLQIKGAQWSRMHIDLRNELRTLFLDILLSDETKSNIERVEYKLMKEYSTALELFIAGDLSQRTVLEKFAERMKSAGKSTKSQYLKQNYKITTDTIYILPLRAQYKGQKKSTLFIPVNEITKANAHRIDDQAILNIFRSQLKKFFDTEGRTATKLTRDDLVNAIEDDEILVRFESATNKQADHQLCHINELKDLCMTNSRYALHEVIHQPVNKLFFDIDKHEIDEAQFKQKVLRILQNLDLDVGELEMFVARRKDTSKYHSYHITFNIVVHLDLNVVIANRLISAYGITEGHQWIDVAPYAVGKTLRLPYSLKIDKTGKRDQTSLMECDCQMKDALLTYIDGYRRIDLPPCLSRKPIIAFSSNPTQMMVQSADHEPAYLELLKILNPHSKNSGNQYTKYYSVKHGHLCPACKKPHVSDNDGWIAVQTQPRQYVVSCFRSNAKGGESRLVIPLRAETIAKLKEQFKNMPLNTKIEFASGRVPTQDQQYVSFDLKHDLLYVKSNMGTGKTDQLIRVLPEYLKNNNAVMLSVRQTLSTEWKARYTRAGISIVDYREVKGTIQPPVGAITIIQVDSLCRLNLADVGMLILDETQSIIAQLHSSQLRDRTGVDNRFVELVKQADKVLCLDANLQETTMDLIDSIRNSTGKLVWNSRKTYTQIETTVRKFQSKGMDHLLQFYRKKVVDEGKNVIGHINSYKKALKVVTYLKQQKPDLKIKFYHGEDKIVEECDGVQKYHKDVKLEDLQHIAEVWKQQQVVIYTGTISAGIDFSELHFHENISVFTSRANSADQFMQGVMRCRKLIDNKLTIYVQDLNRQSIVSSHQVFSNYVNDMKAFNIGSNNILNPLFNLQIYLQAYELQQLARPIDVIIATLNNMGMSITYDELKKQETSDQKLYNQIIVNSTKITLPLIKAAAPIKQPSAEFYLNRHIPEKCALLMAEEPNAQLQVDTQLIVFISYAFHQQMTDANAYQNSELLTAAANRQLQVLQALSNDEIQDLIDQVTLYEVYRQSYKVFEQSGQHLVNLTEEQLNTHMQAVLTVHGKQFTNGQQLKTNKLQTIDLPRLAKEVRLAVEFYKQFTTDQNSTELLTIAKQLGMNCRDLQQLGGNLKHIFLKIGLVCKRTLQSRQDIKGADGKRRCKRLYQTTITPLFKNTPLYQHTDSN